MTRSADRKVFLSSTTSDLGPHREAVFQAISGLEGFQCVRREDFDAREWETDPFCRERVAECDIFLGLHGGSPEGSEVSVAKREYDAAVDAGIPRLLFRDSDDLATKAVAALQKMAADELPSAETASITTMRVEGSGAAAVGTGGIAGGAGSVIVGGDVHGGIILGTQKERATNRLSLSAVFMLCLLVFLGSILVFNAVWRSVSHKWMGDRVQETQRQVQAIEERLPPVPALNRGVREYFDEANAKLAEDVWSEGRLELRMLFSGGRLVARDEFLYSNNTVTGKRRSYVDGTGMVFLVDEFASDGRLISKCSYPEGMDPKGMMRPCISYLDRMHSPLPPLGQLFYR